MFEMLCNWVSSRLRTFSNWMALPISRKMVLVGIPTIICFCLFCVFLMSLWFRVAWTTHCVSDVTARVNFDAKYHGNIAVSCENTSRDSFPCYYGLKDVGYQADINGSSSLMFRMKLSSGAPLESRVFVLFGLIPREIIVVRSQARGLNSGDNSSTAAITLPVWNR